MENMYWVLVPKFWYKQKATQKYLAKFCKTRDPLGTFQEASRPAPSFAYKGGNAPGHESSPCTWTCI